jgi:hypothetical protein
MFTRCSFVLPVIIILIQSSVCTNNGVFLFPHRHTISAAHACFLDPVLGSLSEGKYADFVVLPSTSWDEFSDDIPGHVLATYVNGKQAYP